MYSECVPFAINRNFTNYSIVSRCKCIWREAIQELAIDLLIGAKYATLSTRTNDVSRRFDSQSPRALHEFLLHSDLE